MILDDFGPDALPLLVSGSLGGLVRGLIVFRSVIAKGPVTRQIAVATALDTGTSIIIGAIISMFLHGAADGIFDLPFLSHIALEGTARTATSGFLAGFGAIAIGGALWDFFSGIEFFKKKDPPTAPPITNPGIAP